MGNLSELNASQTIKIAGSGTDGTETGFVKEINNRLAVDAILNSTPLTATFTINAQDIQIGNNKSMMSILNGPSSGVVLRLRDLRIINVQTTSVTGIIGTFEKRRFTTHSGGTLLVPSTYDTADTLDSDVTIRTGATIGSEEGIIRRWKFSTDEWGVGPADVESNSNISQIYFNLLIADQYTKPFTIRPGQGVHIKQTTNSTVGTFDIIAVFTQEAA